MFSKDNYCFYSLLHIHKFKKKCLIKFQEKERLTFLNAALEVQAQSTR